MQKRAYRNSDIDKPFLKFCALLLITETFIGLAGYYACLKYIPKCHIKIIINVPEKEFIIIKKNVPEKE